MLILLSRDSVYSVYPFKCFLCLPKPSGRMHAHIVTYAAHPTLPHIIPSVDESSAHKLLYWYLVTPGAGTGESSS